MSCLNHREVAEIQSGNVFIRRCPLPMKGDSVQGHAHHYDHTTIVVLGSVRVTVDGEATTLVAPAHVLIRKEGHHHIEALVDSTEFWCVYAHRNAQGEVVQEPVKDLDVASEAYR